MTWSHSDVPNAGGVLPAKFGSVGDVFAKNFHDDYELGGCFSAVIDGEMVIDIRGGHVDKAKETPWTEDAVACIYSSGKAVVAFLIAKAVSNNLLDYEAPVAQYWPEFAQAGKEAITVGQLLSHQAGLCAIAEEMPPEEWLDWEAITDRLAAMTPLWPPGTANGYHPQTYGYLAGELLLRVTGKSVGEQLASEELQLYCGMRPDQMVHAAGMTKPPKAPDLGDLNEFTKLAFLSKWSSTARVPREEWMAAEIPASNMHADARSLAAIVHPLANDGNDRNGARVLTSNAIGGALAERIRGDDLVLPFHLSWAAGLMRNINGHYGPNKNAFGHGGFGGSCVLIDPENRLTAAYVMNKMSPHLIGDPRAMGLLNALYDCL